jgi:hypothetical protein
VNIAFHFNADAEKYGGYYGKPIQELFFRLLLSASQEDVHLKIFCGDLLVWEYLRNPEARERVLRGLLGHDLRWKDIDPNEFADALFSKRIYVLAVEGLTPALRDQIHLQLKKDDAYLGAVEIHAANPTHWRLYQRSLIPKYRFFNGELRVFYYALEEAEGADVVQILDYLQKLPFRSLTREDLGVRHTVFDAYDSFEHASRVAHVADSVSGHVASVASDVLLRLGDVNPQLIDALYAMLNAFGSMETKEEAAHVALSCRRFLEGLADVLYPARAETPGGRKVGMGQHINRLWAYAEERLPKDERRAIQEQLEDLGHRIDRIHDLANKGLHARISRSDAGRLIVALVVLTYDLLSLAEPPLQLPLEPHAEEIDRFARRLVEGRAKPPKVGDAGSDPER